MFARAGRYVACLGLVAFVAGYLKKQQPEFEIPLGVMAAASKIRGTLVPQPSGPSSRIWAQYEATSSANIFNAKPTEFDLRRSILELKAIDKALTPKQCVEQCPCSC